MTSLPWAQRSDLRDDRAVAISEHPPLPARRLLLLGLGAALVGACAPVSVRRDTQAIAAAEQELKARGLDHFRLQGRVALSDGEQGGS